MTDLPDSTIAHLRLVIDTPDLSETPYRLLQEIGRGGMGAVYLVLDTRLGRRAALKVLSSLDHQAAARMWREAEVIAKLEHPGIVPIHDAGTLLDGRVFYVMKLVQGSRLDEYASGKSLAELLRVFLRVCEPVAFAHAHEVIHRDLKPENIMVGSFGEVLILDWGVAKVRAVADGSGPSQANSRLTAHGTVVGTPDYMAPEQASGETDVDERADVYALGRILGSLVDKSGRSGGPLQAVREKACAYLRSERYTSVQELIDEINRYLNREPVQAYPEPVWEKAIRVAGTHKTLLALIGVYLIMRALLFFLTRG